MALGFDRYSFYCIRVEQLSDGTFEVADEEKDLERDFLGLRFKSLSGVGDYGKVKGVYSESYAEVDGVSVYISSDVVREQSEVKLSLHFLCADDTVTDMSSQEDAARSVYEAFMDFISGCLLVYRDTIRQRRMLLYLDEASEPSTDCVNGKAYLTVQFTLKSVFGRSFPLDDTTIAEYLGVDEFPVYGS